MFAFIEGTFEIVCKKKKKIAKTKAKELFLHVFFFFLIVL